MSRDTELEAWKGPWKCERVVGDLPRPLHNDAYVYDRSGECVIPGCGGKLVAFERRATSPGTLHGELREALEDLQSLRDRVYLDRAEDDEILAGLDAFLAAASCASHPAPAPATENERIAKEHGIDLATLPDPPSPAPTPQYEWVEDDNGVRTWIEPDAPAPATREAVRDIIADMFTEGLSLKEGQTLSFMDFADRILALIDGGGAAGRLHRGLEMCGPSQRAGHSRARCGQVHLAPHPHPAPAPATRLCPVKHGAEREMELCWYCETCSHREPVDEEGATT